MEPQSNWVDSIEEKRFEELLKDANIVGNHVVYLVNVVDDGERSSKVRLCVHGNEDALTDDIRADLEVPSYNSFRPFYSMAAQMKMVLVKVDVKGGYFQSGLVGHDLFARPP